MVNRVDVVEIRMYIYKAGDRVPDSESRYYATAKLSGVIGKIQW